MTAIRVDHVEWAVVDRFRSMLDAGHPEFGVTHAFSMFQAIVCWVCQRTKDLGDSEADREVRKLVKALRRERIEDAPWSLWTALKVIPLSAQAKIQIGPFQQFERMKVDRFFRVIRNALAHGDARRVRPVNASTGRTPETQLLGYHFDCWETDEKSRVRTWSGSITLTQADMQRLGVELASRFCTRVERLHNGQNADVPAEARRYVTESRTAA